MAERLRHIKHKRPLVYEALDSQRHAGGFGDRESKMGGKTFVVADVGDVDDNQQQQQQVDLYWGLCLV
jgi:hypothetical protein